MSSTKYKTCKKCGVRHSAVVPHKCFKVAKDKPPKLDEVEHDLEKGGETESEGVGKNPVDEPAEGKTESAKGETEGEGDGEGEQSEGDGDGEAEGEGEGDGEDEGEGEDEREEEGEGPAPQSPEPEAPPVQVVCTVLKFAALCAQCAKYGSIEITLSEDGLFVYGHNGDATAYDTIPWGEFEKRSTLDGEFYVKDVIDGVDRKLNEEDDKARLEALIQQAKDEQKAKPKAKTPEAKAESVPKLTLPLTVGQKVVRRDGTVGTVKEVSGTSTRAIARYEDLTQGVWADKGRSHRTLSIDTPRDAMHDAFEEAGKATAKKRKAA